jgi:hypothetical protein
MFYTKTFLIFRSHSPSKKIEVGHGKKWILNDTQTLKHGIMAYTFDPGIEFVE